MQHLLAKPVPLIWTCAIVFVIAAAVIDTTGRRIPNVLTVPAAALGLVANCLVAGGSGLLAGVAGLVVGLATFLPFYLARGFSAGDVKAMAAIGAFLGPKGVLLAAAWTLVAGALGATALLLCLGGCIAMKALICRWSTRALVLLSTGSLARIEAPVNDVARHRFPYGVAIACGTMASLAWS